MKWGKAQKKPIIVEFRQPAPNWTHPNGIEYEIINTLEGKLLAKPGSHLIIKGIEGEIYPIDLSIFNKTYDVIAPIATNSSKEDIQ